MHVLLWDIDGTLLTTARAGVFALTAAAQEVCGSEPDLDALPTAGLTDAQVAALVVDACGHDPDDATVQRFLRVYERELPDRLSWRQGQVLPGVAENLAALTARDDVVNLLLTGNTEAGAAAKLAHYGLDHFFPLGGAFCTDGGERAGMARRAVALAAEHLGRAVDPDRTYVIGDTVHDIACGQAIGARTVAVAFTHTAEELADAWLVLDGLPEPEAFADALGLSRDGSLSR